MHPNSLRLMPKTSTITTLFLFAVAVSPLLVSANVNAQTPSPSASPAAIASPVTSPTPVPEPKVVAVEGNLQLDDLIKVQLEGLNEWAEQNDPTKLVPYINGLAIRGNYPQEIHASKNHLQFHLEITPDNKQMWIDLLGEPRAARRAVAFSVGFEDKSPFDSVIDQTNPVLLTVISPAYGLSSLRGRFPDVYPADLAGAQNESHSRRQRLPGYGKAEAI